MGRIILFSVLALAGLACAWLAVQAYMAGSMQGTALFGAFGALFLAIPLGEIVRFFRTEIPSDTREQSLPAGPTFVPHWQVMAMIAVALAAILLVIAISLLR
jgi:hypothetical protein